MTLKDRVAAMKRRYWWFTGGQDAECLYVPRHMLRDVCAAIADEFDDMPPKHHIYHALSTGEGEVSILGLDVKVGGDAHELSVGAPAE